MDNDDESHPFAPPMPDLGEVGGNIIDSAAKPVQEAVRWFVANTSSWWVQTTPPDLEAEPSVELLQNLMQPIAVTVAMAAMLIVAGKMALTRKANPLVDAVTGLIVVAAVAAIGVVVPNILLQWGHAWSSWALNASSHGGFAARMTAIVTFPTGTPGAVVFFLGIVALLIGAIQAILLLFRQAALIILAGLLPLAAAGMITPATQPWFKKVTGWGLALIFYEPAAAAVYSTAFILIGNGKDLRAVLMGFTMMAISLVAFPVLLRFFAWTTGRAEASPGGGVLTAVMGGATAIGALRAYGFGEGSGGASSGGGSDTSASEHAGYLRQQLGDQDPAGEQGMEQQPTGDDSASLIGNQTTATATTHQATATSGHGSHPAEPENPTGSSQHMASDQATGGRDVPASGGEADEPVGPAGMRTWDRERHRASDSIRWMGNPAGSGDQGGPTGAADGGGGGGGGA
ncbi:hypothetical protein [Spirillospora sp. NPDC047279]|uniref:hypothetical protein n=1 Tax=Spirillospora sp. NPDC047279 TaxID=3155478 RepID=UPI0033CA8BF0